MRRVTWMLLATAALWLVGCATAPLGPSAITDIEGAVVGYEGGADLDYEGRITPMSSVVATGVLDATSSTFSATFDTVPLAELQTIEAFVAPILGKGGTCDLNVVPADLQIGILTTFRAGDGSLLQRSSHDPWGAGSPVVGDTTYQFVFATRDGRLDGSCTDAKAGVTRFVMPLARGWNPVAVRVLAVDEGITTDRRWRTEMPAPDAPWWYRALVKVII